MRNLSFIIQFRITNFESIMVMQLHVIAYDIRSDQRRRKVSTLLEDYGGTRINQSVFEIALSAADKQQVLSQLSDLIDLRTDQVACYPLCRACYTRSVYLPEPTEIPTGRIRRA